ncbi:MAG: CapA family protein [Nitrospinae bacterium]|nr:CapA family protein [Nitrospinota bacterium]
MPPRTKDGPKLLAGGDIAINRSEAKGAFGKLIPLLREADVSFANLELPLSHGGKPAPEKILLRGAPDMAHALTEAGFDVMAFANNHVLDYGEDAFAETMSLMDSLGVALVGGGMNLAQARKPVLIERGNLTIGFLAYCSVIPRGFEATVSDPGVNPIRAHTAYRPWRDLSEYPGTPPRIDTWAEPAHLARMKRDIRNFKKKADLVVVNHHWGTSMTHEVMDFEREIAHASIDAGADLILGGHPHVLQAIEFHKGAPIVYSMGNLIFDFEIPFFTDETHDTFLFGCTLTKQGVRELYLMPVTAGVFSKPRLHSPSRGDGRRIVDVMNALNEPFGTRLEVQDDRVSISAP